MVCSFPCLKTQFGFGADGNETCRRLTNEIVTLTARSIDTAGLHPSATADYTSKRQNCTGFGYTSCLAQLSETPCGEQPATGVCSGCCARRLLRRPHTSSKHTRIVQPVGKLALQVYTFALWSRLCLPRPSNGCLTAGGLPSTSASDFANVLVNTLPSRTFCSGVAASNSAQTGRVFPHEVSCTRLFLGWFLQKP